MGSPRNTAKPIQRINVFKTIFRLARPAFLRFGMIKLQVAQFREERKRREMLRFIKEKEDYNSTRRFKPLGSSVIALSNLIIRLSLVYQMRLPGFSD